MTEPNFIILIDLDSGKTVLQNCILKITKNNCLKSKKKRSGPFDIFYLDTEVKIKLKGHKI